MLPDTKVYRIVGANMQVVGPPDRTVYYDHPTPGVDESLFLWWKFENDGAGDPGGADGRNVVFDYTASLYNFGMKTTLSSNRRSGPIATTMPQIVNVNLSKDEWSSTPDFTGPWARRHHHFLNTGETEAGEVSGSDEALALFTSSSYTIMARYRIFSGAAAATITENGQIFSLGTSTRRSVLFSVGNTSNIGAGTQKKLTIGWTSGSSNTGVYTSSSNIPMENTDTWYHVAVTVEMIPNSFPAPLRNVRFWVDGQLSGHRLAVNGHTNGLTHDAKMGVADGAFGPTTLWGDITDVIVYTEKLADEEIQSAYQNQNNRVKETKIFAHWPHDEEPIFDYAGTHYLTLMTGTLESGSIDFNMVSYTGSTNTNRGAIGPTTQALRDVLTGSDYTLEAWIYPKRQSDGGIFFHGIGPEQNTHDGKDLISFRLDTTVGHKLRVELTGAGAPAAGIDVTGSTDITTGSWHHVAVRRTFTSFPSSTVDLFVDGRLDKTSGSLLTGDPNDAGGRMALVVVGSTRPSGGGWSNDFFGAIGDIKLYSRARTNAEISASWVAGVPAI